MTPYGTDLRNGVADSNYGIFCPVLSPDLSLDFQDEGRSNVGFPSLSSTHSKNLGDLQGQLLWENEFPIVEALNDVRFDATAHFNQMSQSFSYYSTPITQEENPAAPSSPPPVSECSQTLSPSSDQDTNESTPASTSLTRTISCTWPKCNKTFGTLSGYK